MTRIGRWASPICLVAAIMVAWHHTFYEMWLRWFPAWRETYLSISERIAPGDSYYSHSPLVILASTILAVLIYRRNGWPQYRTTGSTLIGFAAVALFATLHLLSTYADVTFVSGFALIGTIGSVIVWSGGWPALRAYWIPVALLVFLIPLPLHWIAEFNYDLKMWAAYTAGQAASSLFAIPMIIDGSSIFCTPAADGQPHIIMIENACSGLRNLIAMIWFGALFAATCRVTGRYRWLMLFASIPVALAANVARIVLLIVATDWGYSHMIAPGTWMHDLIGLLTFMLATMMFMIGERAILSPSRNAGNAGFQPRLFAFIRQSTLVQQPQRVRVGIPASMMCVVAITSVYLNTTDATPTPSRYASQAAPHEFTLGTMHFTSKDARYAEATTALLKTEDCLTRTYRDAATNTTFTLTIVYSDNDRRSVHPPEVCLTAAGNEITQQTERELMLSTTQTIPFRELLTRDDSRTTCHLYTFRCGQAYTTAFAAQQAGVFLGTLTGHDKASALIHIAMPCADTDIDRTRQLTMTAAQLLMPHIDARLP